MQMQKMIYTLLCPSVQFPIQPDCSYFYPKPSQQLLEHLQPLAATEHLHLNRHWFLLVDATALANYHYDLGRRIDFVAEIGENVVAVDSFDSPESDWAIEEFS